MLPWLPEVASLAVAVAALIAVAITLVKYHNQEQPNWPEAGMLNLSALVALLATLLRMMITQVVEAGKTISSAHDVHLPLTNTNIGQSSGSSNGTGLDKSVLFYTCRFVMKPGMAPGARYDCFSVSDKRRFSWALPCPSFSARASF